VRFPAKHFAYPLLDVYGNHFTVPADRTLLQVVISSIS
jgi:hypothetical protein